MVPMIPPAPESTPAQDQATAVNGMPPEPAHAEPTPAPAGPPEPAGSDTHPQTGRDDLSGLNDVSLPQDPDLPEFDRDIPAVGEPDWLNTEQQRDRQLDVEIAELRKRAFAAADRQQRQTGATTDLPAPEFRGEVSVPGVVATRAALLGGPGYADHIRADGPSECDDGVDHDGLGAADRKFAAEPIIGRDYPRWAEAVNEAAQETAQRLLAKEADERFGLGPAAELGLRSVIRDATEALVADVDGRLIGLVDEFEAAMQRAKAQGRHLDAAVNAGQARAVKRARRRLQDAAAEARGEEPDREEDETPIDLGAIDYAAIDWKGPHRATIRQAVADRDGARRERDHARAERDHAVDTLTEAARHRDRYLLERDEARRQAQVLGQTVDGAITETELRKQNQANAIRRLDAIRDDITRRRHDAERLISSSPSARALADVEEHLRRYRISLVDDLGGDPNPTAYTRENHPDVVWRDAPARDEKASPNADYGVAVQRAQRILHDAMTGRDDLHVEYDETPILSSREQVAEAYAHAEAIGRRLDIPADVGATKNHWASWHDQTTRTAAFRVAPAQSPGDESAETSTEEPAVVDDRRALVDGLTEIGRNMRDAANILVDALATLRRGFFLDELRAAADAAGPDELLPMMCRSCEWKTPIDAALPVDEARAQILLALADHEATHQLPARWWLEPRKPEDQLSRLEAWLHNRQMHPDWEYTPMSNPADDDWERRPGDSYWRRRRPVPPVLTEEA